MRGKISPVIISQASYVIIGGGDKKSPRYFQICSQRRRGARSEKGRRKVSSIHLLRAEPSPSAGVSYEGLWGRATQRPAFWEQSKVPQDESLGKVSGQSSGEAVLKPLPSQWKRSSYFWVASHIEEEKEQVCFKSKTINYQLLCSMLAVAPGQAECETFTQSHGSEMQVARWLVCSRARGSRRPAAHFFSLSL